MVVFFFPYSSEELRRWFLTQETELMRFRLLNGPPGEREQMILRYPEHLPLKRVLIPTVTELEKRERNGEVVSDEDFLLSEEIEKVYPTTTIKEEMHIGKIEKDSGKNQKEADRSSSLGKSGSPGKEPNHIPPPENKAGSVEVTVQQNRRDYYKVCRGCADFVVSYPVYHCHALEGQLHGSSGSCSTSRSDHQGRKYILEYMYPYSPDPPIGQLGVQKCIPFPIGLCLPSPPQPQDGRLLHMQQVSLPSVTGSCGKQENRRRTLYAFRCNDCLP